jgi:hypothetical protein
VLISVSKIPNAFINGKAVYKIFAFFSKASAAAFSCVSIPI